MFLSVITLMLGFEKQINYGTENEKTFKYVY